jgi:hypothetical protein
MQISEEFPQIGVKRLREVDVLVTHRFNGYAHVRVEGICDAAATDSRVQEVAIREVWRGDVAPFGTRDYYRSMDGRKFGLTVHID